MESDIVARLRRYEGIPFKGQGDMAYRLADAKKFLSETRGPFLAQARVRATICDLDDVMFDLCATVYLAANEIERLRARVARLEAGFQDNEMQREAL